MFRDGKCCDKYYMSHKTDRSITLNIDQTRFIVKKNLQGSVKHLLSLDMHVEENINKLKIPMIQYKLDYIFS